MIKELATIISARQEELLELLRKGDITELSIKPTFVVQDAFEKNDVKYPAISYNPCFSYIDKDGNKFVEDVQTQSEAHKVLRTLFEYCYIYLKIKDIN
jgi:hypothetical protein